MLLDVSDARGEYTSLDEIPGVQAALSIGTHRYSTIRAQNSGLLSLSIAPTAILQHVTSLTASHNRISTLQGLDAFPCLEFLDLSHNALRVIDSHSASLLCHLRRLRRCDLSHNEMHFVDLDVSSRDHSKNGGDPRALTLDELATLNLSHNHLLEVPDLRCMPVLEELFLDHNRIENLSDLDSRVPLVAMCTLSLSHNTVALLQGFLPLTALAETLHTVGIAGNPCVQDATVGALARPWLLWLLPFLSAIDDVPLSQEERDAAARLFRVGGAGKLNYEAMQVMNNLHGTHLETYLRKVCPEVVVAAARVGTTTAPNVAPVCTKQQSAPSAGTVSSAGGSLALGTFAAREDVSMSGKNVIIPSPSISASAACPLPAASVEASLAGSFIRRPSTEVVLQAMQKKLRQLSSIVEVLWGESMTRRVFATIALQKHVRGFITRRHLPLTVQRRCASIRQNLRRLRHATRPAPTAPTAPAASTAPIGDGALQSLEELVHKMWAEMEDHRRLLARRRHIAALTIQRHYRGRIGRKHWRGLRERYDEFIASLRPGVVFLQRVGRAFARRRRLAREHRHTREVRMLRAEICELRQCVQDMQASMQQSFRRERLHRYANPTAAMDEIVARHYVARVEGSVTVDTPPLVVGEKMPDKEVTSILEEL